MKDRFGKEIKERRDFSQGEPPKGVSKMAIRFITILLFMIAAVIFFFPSGGDNTPEPDGSSSAKPASEAVAD